MVKQAGIQVGDAPGREIAKEYREVAAELVRNQGWRYQVGRGYPRLVPPDKTKSPVSVPRTPAARGRSFENWVADLKRAGAILPPPRKK